MQALPLVELSEVFWSRCGQGYVDKRGGSSHAAARLSTNSKKMFTSDDWTRFWKAANDEPTTEKNYANYYAALDSKADEAERHATEHKATLEEMKAKFELLKALEAKVKSEKRRLSRLRRQRLCARSATPKRCYGISLRLRRTSSADVETS
ncbi:hypothetical protein BAUCODRAFT_38028 [Baudoinia panamericana UAMH 10762]|uniref:Uncharacterized protein n=1 Tax=Baudoinia panamericana (strain UAMH 10762) TaxID=717646 RepID=M2N349_BAUPA|nr:uncharacterized protein BAUCODRAFT_38028 [Baudoinia panamericana UAMH 10762]EMC93110.1 hypothetical protein BAUCODRAFT_38028 [Baudoinia panamericana UAMH 10762]